MLARESGAHDPLSGARLGARFQLGLRPAERDGLRTDWMVVFPGPAEDCRAAGAVVPDVGIGVVTAAPGNLRSTVTGTTVRLDWNGLLEPVVGFLVEAGSASTLANLARLNTGSVSLALVW